MLLHVAKTGHVLLHASKVKRIPIPCGLQTAGNNVILNFPYLYELKAHYASEIQSMFYSLGKFNTCLIKFFYTEFRAC
jgi:hypothetical protein